FLGNSFGEAGNLESCLKAVRWMFEDAALTFHALATETAQLAMKMLAVQDLFFENDQYFCFAERELKRLFRGGNERKPSPEALTLLCEVHNALGANGGTGYAHPFACLQTFLRVFSLLLQPFCSLFTTSSTRL